jgi:hypothetical protein
MYRVSLLFIKNEKKMSLFELISGVFLFDSYNIKLDDIELTTTTKINIHL